jgi:ribonuclease Z
MKITFLGTAGSFISKERTYPSILIHDDLLLDCGEGTTQKLLKVEKIEKINTICISHLHNDHFLGLFSLLWYYWINERKKPLKIIGPENTQPTVKKILNLINTPKRMKSFEIDYESLKNDIGVQSIRAGEYIIKAVKVSHLEPSFAFRIEIKRRSICYSGDTKPSKEYIELFRDCSLLIHESTFPNEFKELAHKLDHSIPEDIAKIANTIRCKNVALIHISPSFQNQINHFENQILKIFDGNLYIPDDLTTIDI